MVHTLLLLPWHTENWEWPFCRCTKYAWKTNENKDPESTKLPQSKKKLLCLDHVSDGEKLIIRQLKKKKNQQETFNLTGEVAYDTCTSSDYFTLGIWKHRIRLFPIPIPSHPFSMLTALGERFLGTNLTGGNLLQISG